MFRQDLKQLLSKFKYISISISVFYVTTLKSRKKKSTHDHNLKMDFILIFVSSQKNNFVIIKQDHLNLINKTVLGEYFCFVLVRKFFF